MPSEQLPINFGQPGVGQVVGRDADLKVIQNALLRGSSVLLTGERRIGKSWILQALLASPPKGWVAVYTDVEPINSVEQLTEVLSERITQVMPRARRAIERSMSAGITEIRGMPIPQRREREPVDRLRRLIRGTVDGGKRKLILILDELPILAQKLEKVEEGSAVALLQLLRALRMEEPNLRMVLAGSIGLHHLLAGDAEINAAVNDVLPVPIGALLPTDATELAERLLRGIGITGDVEAPTAAIAEVTDGIPFYIQNLVAELEGRTSKGEPLSAQLVRDVRDAALRSGDDPWRTRHYRRRLKEYFGEQAPLAESVLDAISIPEDGLGFDPLLDRLRADTRTATRWPQLDESEVRGVVERLRLDHYLTLDANYTIRFTFRVIRDAWRAMQLR
jgi:uncharacterized protein